MNHNMMLNRQSYLDYTSYSNPGKQELRNTQPPKEKENSYSQRSVQNSSTAQNTHVNDAYKIFKKAKKNISDYKINPDVIPRPKHYEEIYKSSTKTSVYSTNEDSLPPFTTSYFIVDETQNSSPRLIRSSLTKIPTDQDQFNKSSLIFGIYCQPFAELQPGDRPIPQVQVSDDILRCTRCFTYVNNKFEFKYNKNSKRIAVCNCCGYELELNTTNSSVKSEYFSSDLSSVVELSSPTVDFVAPAKFIPKNTFTPVYAIFIDTSQLSIELGFASYVLNSILSSLDFFDNKSNSSILLASYDSVSINFYMLDNSGEVKVLIVSDLETPFCPIPKEKLLLNVENDKNSIEKIIERIQTIITHSSFSFEKKSAGAATGAAIHAGYNTLLGGNGGRVIILTCNPCLTGIGNSKARESFNLMGTENEKNLYTPQNDYFSKIASESNEKEKIVFDLFVIHNQQFDLCTLSQICNLTGGTCFYYNLENSIDIKYKFENLHYDLTRTFTRSNYNNVAFKLRANSGIDIVELLGSFGKRPGSAVSLAGCDPDYSFSFLCRIQENLKPNSRIHFQLAVIFTDNYNKRFLRVLNYTILTSTDTMGIYKSIDCDVYTKIALQKELNQMLNSGFNSVRTDLYNKTINCLFYYRDQTQKGQLPGQLILPDTLKYFPLYLSSFFKKPVFRINKQGITINSVIDLINKIQREPTYLITKNLYPKFYRVDDIREERPEIVDRLRIDKDYLLDNIGANIEELNIIQKPYIHALTVERVCFDGAYLLDTGRFFFLCIFEETSPDFLSEIFNVSSFHELVTANIESLDENNNNDLNVRLLNIINQIRRENKGIYQPLKILLLNSNSSCDEFYSNLIEDTYKGEAAYIDFLCDIHSNIQSKQNKY